MAILTPLRRRVALSPTHPSTSLHDGGHPSRQLGRSHEFHDLRDYVRGDNVRDIDWRATARAGKPLVKRTTAQRQTTLWILAATGRDSTGHAAPGILKRDVVVELAGTLGVVATGGGDRVGALWTEDGGVRATRPSSRPVELERALQSLAGACHDDAAPADLPLLTSRAAALLRGRDIVAVIADDVEVTAVLERPLRQLSARHDVWWCTVPDADPWSLDGAVRGTSEARTLPAALRRDARLRSEFEELRTRRARDRRTALQRLSVRSMDLEAADVPGQALLAVRRWRRAR